MPPKIWENIFCSIFYKYRVKFGHFVNYITYIFGQKCLDPKVDYEHAITENGMRNSKPLIITDSLFYLASDILGACCSMPLNATYWKVTELTKVVIDTTDKTEIFSAFLRVFWRKITLIQWKFF